jgi:hypothetical protein
MSNMASAWRKVAAAQVVEALGAARVLIEKSDGWYYDEDDGNVVEDAHNVMWHITAYKGGKSIASSGGHDLDCAVRNVIGRGKKKEPEED